MAVHGRTLRREATTEERMRGDHSEPDAMFSYISAAQRVPKDHPLRAIRTMVDDVLRRLWSDFERLYSHTGRPSIPPERLLRALLLQVLYSIRSERMLMEQLDYNLLFRWFVGLSMDDPIWDATVFTKNRDRLLRGDIAVRFFEQVLAEARERGLTSDEHFTVDGTLVEAWAGLKSLKRKDGSDGQNPPDDPGNPTVNFHGQKRSNRTHGSTTDPDSLLARKGKSHEAKLYFMGHVVMENRGGLAVGARLTRATGYAEREAALAMVGEIPRHRRISLAADKGYDAAEFVEDLREQHVTPHVAQKARYSAIDGQTTRHLTYQVSQRARKRVEEIFGWLKTVGMMRKVRHRGLPRVGWNFTFALAAYNLVRMRNLTLVTT
jgi:transposase